MKFCSLMSGSSGNCQFIESEGTKLLIDAGLSGKKAENLLKEIDIDASDIDGILLTHEHSDHIKGAGVLSRRYDIPIYANEGTWIGIEDSIGKIRENNIKLIDREEFEIGNLGIRTFDLYHDCNQPLGFTFHRGEKKIGVLMDTGKVDQNILNKIDSCDILLIESNHDENLLKIGNYPIHLKKRIMGSWGHLSNDAAADIIKEVSKKDNSIVVLGHLSKENNFPELAYSTIDGALKSSGIDEVKIKLSSRYFRTELFKL
ncbi:MAG: MBL fold metallo-hydrolase [Andreesenia angusta]|nr:MBL fold metallo-hydrolase [Andreesenia angusta]